MKTLFDLNISSQSADVVAIPVPWDVTASYHDGAHKGPEAILKASTQLDLYHPDFESFIEHGAAMLPVDKALKAKNKDIREKAKKIITQHDLGKSIDDSEELLADLDAVNQASEDLNEWVRAATNKVIDEEQMVAIVGGEHGCGLGALEAISERFDTKFGVLQLDAHMDLREAYQGFNHSHASAMHNVLKLSNVQRLIQVGVRDYSHEEHQRVKNSKGRIAAFTAKDMQDHLFTGKSWQQYCKKIINQLPDLIFISLDVDALSPEVCPNTGTPVPGGLTYSQVAYLLSEISRLKKQIIGVELVEVAPGVNDNDLNANTGARLLYLLSGYMWQSWQE